MTTRQRPKSVILASGGLDSTVAMAGEINAGYDVTALTINYGQRHTAEFTAIENIVRWYRQRGVNLKHETVDLGNLGGILRSVLTRPAMAVPEGHYAEPTMAATVVPNRNMILIAVASGYAESIGAGRVVVGCHSGDHHIYPDCRPLFISRAHDCVNVATEGKVRLIAPYIGIEKSDIVLTGVAEGAPMHLTWSCYQTPDGTGRHCGVCGTCNERKEAFKVAAEQQKNAMLNEASNFDGNTRKTAIFDCTDPTEYAS